MYVQCMPHICVSHVSVNIFLRKSFAFKVSSLIFYHKVNIPKTVILSWMNENVNTGLFLQGFGTYHKELKTFFTF